jgi:hypothetical protein
MFPVDDCSALRAYKRFAELAVDSNEQGQAKTATFALELGGSEELSV